MVGGYCDMGEIQAHRNTAVYMGYTSRSIPGHVGYLSNVLLNELLNSNMNARMDECMNE